MSYSQASLSFLKDKILSDHELRISNNYIGKGKGGDAGIGASLACFVSSKALYFNVALECVVSGLGIPHDPAPGYHLPSALHISSVIQLGTWLAHHNLWFTSKAINDLFDIGYNQSTGCPGPNNVWSVHL